ncbi:hypothetical protein D3C81_1260650 [compost metagenome]
MIVTIDQQGEQYIESTYQSLSDWWNMATVSINQQQRLIYWVKIDDAILYDGYEQYMVNQYNSISTIDVKTFSRLESIQQTANELDLYLDRFIPSSLKISQYFFGDLTEVEWSQFADFIQGLHWITQALEFQMELFNQENMVKPEYLSITDKLKLILPEMENGLQIQDYVVVGDIIQYEIIPALQSFRLRYTNQG